MPENSNYEERKDGWHKKDVSVQKGNADYFNRPIPPVRDSYTGHPLGSDGKIDWKRVIRETNEKNNGG